MLNKTYTTSLKPQSLYGKHISEKSKFPSRRNVSCHYTRFATDSSEYLLHHGKPPEILEHPTDDDVPHLQRDYHVDGAYTLQPLVESVSATVRAEAR